MPVPEGPELWVNEEYFHLLFNEIAACTLVSADRCFMLFQMARYAQRKQGEFAEVGVYKGGTARLIAKVCPNKKVHLFDTFSGLPKGNPDIDIHEQGDFADISLESVQNFLRDCNNVVYHPGFFPDTAKEIIEKFSLVHIDVDLYQSVKDSLEIFYNKLVPGGVMVFDDYEWPAYPGVKKAVNEFLIGKPEVPIITAKYQCMLIKIENSISGHSFYQHNGSVPEEPRVSMAASTEDFVKNVYRDLLHREPDPEGFNFYLSELKSGRLNKAEMIKIFLNSEEYKNMQIMDKKEIGTTIHLNPIQKIKNTLNRLYQKHQYWQSSSLSGEIPETTANKPDIIDPKKLMEELTIEDLCRTAELYYKSISDPTPQMAKPFSSILEAPDMLCKLGLLISGLKLGKSMVVLDFGAGTCWLSRFLNQLKCSTICVDVSITALNLGKKLFDNFPIIGQPFQPPQFIHFNGHRLDIEDESVDRIICFDTFHHIPNQNEILREFYRVLKPGGIAGFSEPGSHHSQSPQSQYEMRNYHVLENDIILSETKNEAEAIGFSNLYVKLVSHPDLDLEYNDYEEIISHKSLPKKVQNHLFISLENSVVFFLTKGKFIPDSRSHLGLKHSIEMSTTNYQAKLNEPIYFKLIISNTGSSRWLHKNTKDLGVVMLGVHLYDENDKLINLDFFRDRFEQDINPGQIIEKTISLTFDKPGKYSLAFDLVSEGVCWFENVGSEPKSIRVIVEE
jgi:ubiquinone/menaquinone biosynthesis C-methylase UbiE